MIPTPSRRDDGARGAKSRATPIRHARALLLTLICTAVFPSVATAEIRGEIFVDINHNGAVDAGENCLGLAPWTDLHYRCAHVYVGVAATPADAQQVGNVAGVTDDAGSFAISRPPGNYYVCPWGFLPARCVTTTVPVVGMATPRIAISPDDPIPSSAALSSAPPCRGLNPGIVLPDLGRADPAWATILLDARQTFNNAPPTIVEGQVRGTSPNDVGLYEPPSDVAETDYSWNHFTHDKTFQIVPDARYLRLTSALRNGTLATGEIEIEWENAAHMAGQWARNFKFGGLPTFAWPASGDRVWAEGRYVFDCSHTGYPRDVSGIIPTPIQLAFTTEIHPPRALVVSRLLHTMTSTELPVTGDPTVIPTVQADIYVSGFGGEDLNACAVSLPQVFPVYPDGWNICGPTSAWSAVNDRNYVFDVYPPGTLYDRPTGGTFAVSPPSPLGTGTDASLQWRFISRSNLLPPYACGGPTSTTCRSVQPIICPISSAVGEPDQTESTCPPSTGRPNRLRVILPFRGTSANVFAGTVLVGWDDVPSPACDTSHGFLYAGCRTMRTVRIGLRRLSVVTMPAQPPNVAPIPEEWHIFAAVGGEWQYLSNVPSDLGAGCSSSLLIVLPGTCGAYDGHPWQVEVPAVPGRQPTDVHVSLTGFATGSNDEHFCQNLSGCSADLAAGYAFAFGQSPRVGVLDYDLRIGSTGPARVVNVHGGALVGPGPTFLIGEPTSLGGRAFRVAFDVTTPQLPGIATARTSIGMPTKYLGNGLAIVTNHSPFVFTAIDPALSSFQYRFVPSDALPVPVSTYADGAGNRVPNYWRSVGLAQPSASQPIFLRGPDGLYTLEVSARRRDGLTSVRTIRHVRLDSMAPNIRVAPTSGSSYAVGQVFGVSVRAVDPSDVKTLSVSVDGNASRHGASSGLTSVVTYAIAGLARGAHSIAVQVVDGVGNARRQVSRILVV
jgi:hypothetical protein